jgi:hypothetical protein
MPRRTIFVSYHTRAGNGTRTRDPNLGKVVLYQLSYSRMLLALPDAGMACNAPWFRSKQLLISAQWR